MNTEIKYGIPAKQRIKIAKMLYETFEHIFSNIFGNKNKTILLISTCIQDDRTLVAFKDDLAVGLAGLQYCGKSFIDPSLKQVTRIFGLETFRVLLFGGIFLFFNKRTQKEIHLESLAVTTDEQGKGIGSKLLYFVIDYARLKGFSQIRLEVKDSNPNAKRLYERIGFKEKRVQKIPYPFNRLLGIKSIIEMIYIL